METRQLEYFIALANIGSFSRAADTLHITQGALSKSIRALEDAFGGLLVDRLGRQVVLTPMGEFVFERAKRLVQDAENLLRSAEACKSDVRGVLKLGLGAGPGATLGAPLIRHLVRSYPELKLKIRRGSADSLIRDLRDRSIDLLIVDGRMLAPADDLVVETLGGLPGGALCRSGHPLAKEAEVSFEQLIEYPIFSTSASDEAARMVVSRHGPQADLRKCITVECEELETLLAAAVMTDGVFLGVVAAAADQLRSGAMTKLPLVPPVNISVPVVLARLAGRSEPVVAAAVRSFAAVLIAELPC
jgi:DNA-binding transcriptional LysR family regulator